MLINMNPVFQCAALDGKCSINCDDEVGFLSLSSSPFALTSKEMYCHGKMYFVKAVYKSDKGKIPKHYKKDSRELKGFTLSNPLFLSVYQYA